MLKAWLAQLAQRFETAELTFGHGTDNAWDEAVALTLGALDWPDDSGLLDKVLTQTQLAKLERLADRRITEQVPVPMLLGFAYFAGRKFLTAPDVMIPRSPIAELLANSFEPWLPPESHDKALRVLDVCCGGGCIGISIAEQFVRSQVVLSDLDSKALELAQKNIAFHDIASRVEAIRSDLYESLQGRRFDLIVSNPPYVPSADTIARPPEFYHEPALAYDGGPTGLALVRRLLSGAAALLEDDGLLVIEVGQWGDAVEREWPDVSFVWPELQQGGEGILVLEAPVVAEHTARSDW